MSHYYETIVKSSNPDFAEACVAAFEKKGFSTCVNSKDGVTKISLYLNWYFPKKEINAVSKRFPDDIVIVGYSEELHCYYPGFEGEKSVDFFYIWEVRNGEAIAEDMESDYYFRMPSKIAEDWSLICNQVVAFCRKLDKRESDKGGEGVFQWFDEDVVYEFEYDSINGKRYRAEITKRRWVIDFNKVYEQVSNNDWQEITIPAIRSYQEVYEQLCNDGLREITSSELDDNPDYVCRFFNRFY